MKTIQNQLEIQLPPEVGQDLNATLVDLIALALVGKQAHWNVVGPHFRTVHLHLDEIVETARTFGDEIAERAVAIGAFPNGQPEAVAKTTKVPQLPEGQIRDHDAVERICEALTATILGMRQRLERLGENDPVSQDIVIDATKSLEKHLWMLRSSIG